MAKDKIKKFRLTDLQLEQLEQHLKKKTPTSPISSSL
jgi:hypothetical protein